MILNAVFGVIALLGVGFGVRCYVELFKWARQCQNARIVIAHKNKVKLDAPITEWLSWANRLDKDEATSGRTVYRMANASVSLVRIRIVNDRGIRNLIRRLRRG